MIGVGVRVDDELELAAVIGQQREIAVDLLSQRIDQGCLMRRFARQQIRLALAAVSS